MKKINLFILIMKNIIHKCIDSTVTCFSNYIIVFHKCISLEFHNRTVFEINKSPSYSAVWGCFHNKRNKKYQEDMIMRVGCVKEIKKQ